MSAHDARLRWLCRKYEDILDREHNFIRKFGDLFIALEDSQYKALQDEERRIRDQIDRLIEEKVRRI